MKTRSIRLSSILLLLTCCFCFTCLRAQEVDTVYLLNHWSKSRQAGSLRDFDMQFKKAWKDKSFQQSEAVGWDCLRPAWRGIQDSIDLPVFRYHYRPYTYCIGVLRFFVKEEPIVAQPRTAEEHSLHPDQALHRGFRGVRLFYLRAEI